MKIQGAVVKEQGVSFAIVVVKKSVIDNSFKAKEAIQSFAPVFRGLPINLMAQDSRGVPKYYGRSDIVNFLANIQMESIPWREYTV
tara:strand:- start:216 stop:473 length:258 start_codon:yes stop_codon:yes gene_type:complete